MSSLTDRSARPPRRRPRRRSGAGDTTTAGTTFPTGSHATPAAVATASTVPAVRAPAAPQPAPAAGAPVIGEAVGFAELGVAPSLVASLRAVGIEQPFPIQQASVPEALAGRDVLARGRTGSGKTVAFALPVVSRLAASPTSGRRRPRGLVLVPTRELATQVAATFAPLAEAVGLRIVTVFGGVPQSRQERALASGVDIVIACPGRLEDLVNQGVCPLDRIEITVLDEADHLSDLGFLPAVRRLLDRTPADGQRLLFSATLDQQVDAVVRRYLHEPVRCSVDPVDAVPARIDHHVLSVAATDKTAVVTELASGNGPTLLFTRTKHGARKLARRLAKDGIAAVDLHGDLAQNARERNLAAFRDGSASVLVATDIAARGIHVDGVALVVHVDPPAEHKAFTHRSGRTARAGSDGTVVTIATPEQQTDVRKLTKQAGITPTVTIVTPGHRLVAELRGSERAPSTTPARVDTSVRTPSRAARRR